MAGISASRHRSLTLLILFTLTMGLLATVPVTPASANGFRATVFESDFNDLPTGTLSTTPVLVEVGSVLAASAPASIASPAGLNGKAVVVNGAGVADLRFSSYPNELPQALNSERYELVVTADLVAPSITNKGATLYLATVSGQRYEIVTFGAGGTLSRGDTTFSLTYAAGARVQVEARLDLKNGEMILILQTNAGTLTLSGFKLPGSFDPDTVGRLFFAANGATGIYGIDNVRVRVEKDDKKDDPPARIEITQPTYGIEINGDVTLIVLNISMKNSGGRAKNVFLTINLDDDLIDLLDLSWVSGIGYVKEISKGQIVIGIGENNTIRKERYDLKFKFKLKAKRGGSEVKIDFKYKLKYRDSDGDRETSPIVIIVIVPPAGVLPSATPVSTGTPATPTTTGTAGPAPSTTATTTTTTTAAPAPSTTTTATAPAASPTPTTGVGGASLFRP